MDKRWTEEEMLFLIQCRKNKYAEQKEGGRNYEVGATTERGLDSKGRERGLSCVEGRESLESKV